MGPLLPEEQLHSSELLTISYWESNLAPTPWLALMIKAKQTEIQWRLLLEHHSPLRMEGAAPLKCISSYHTLRSYYKTKNCSPSEETLLLRGTAVSSLNGTALTINYARYQRTLNKEVKPGSDTDDSEICFLNSNTALCPKSTMSHSFS